MPAGAPAGPLRLEKGVAQERELAPGESHEYRIAVLAGDYARVTVDQDRMDVAVRLLAPSGEEIAAADGPGGRKEVERLSWIVADGGDFRLVVAPHQPAEAGHYTVTLEELRPSVIGDLERVAAETAEIEASHLAVLGDEEWKRKAIPKLEEALAFWRTAGDRSHEIDTLNHLGVLHRNLGENDRALSLYRQALDLAREAGDRRGEAKARNNLGVAYLEQGENQQALDHLQAAIVLWEALEEPKELANTYYGLGTAQFDSGELDQALASLTRALELLRGADLLDGQAPILTVLATIHRDRGRGDEALEIYRQALGISRSLGDRNDEANVLQNMASTYLRRGELQEALELFTEALKLHRLLGNRSQEGRVLASLGATALYLGDSAGALTSYTQALQIHREMGNATWEGYALRDIGWIYDLREEPKVALEHYTQAYQKCLPLGHRRCQAVSLHGMGRAKIALRAPEEAIEILQQAIVLHRESANALGEIHALTDLGRTYQSLSDETRAAELFQQALALSRQRKTLIAESTALSAVARLERSRGRLAEAAAAMEEALSIIESIRPKVASQRQRVSFFASRREYYDFYVDLRMRMYERDPRGEHLAAALAASERARARGLLDLLAEGRIDVRRGISAELKQEEQEVANRISLLQSQLLDDLSDGGRQSARIEAELDRAEEDRERLEWRIRREHPRYSAFRNPSPLTPESIRGLLDDRSAFLEYAVGKEASYLFVVTRDGMHGYRLPPAIDLAESVEVLREALRDPSRRQYGRYLAEAGGLYQSLLAPAESVLRDKPRLIISPDGPLLLLSFETLLTAPAPAGDRPYQGLPYLIRQKSVTYAPSASVFAELGGPAGGTAPAASGAGLLLGFADPAYGTAAPAGPAQADSSLARALQEAGLPSPRRLPDSRNEMLGIAGLYPPGQARLYLDGDASEENIKSNPALKDADRVHLAVHGFFNEARPELSGLVLALDDDPGEDGLLQVYEIFNLELSADLVVLSACDTALGKNVSGEGILGVSRALLYAGAASVVVSLWQVSDASTSELMIRFYRHLNESGDKAEALRLSKLELIEEGYEHPYHWAPFILIGQPGPAVTYRRLARQ